MNIVMLWVLGITACVALFVYVLGIEMHLYSNSLDRRGIYNDTTRKVDAILMYCITSALVLGAVLTAEILVYIGMLGAPT